MKITSLGRMFLKQVENETKQSMFRENQTLENDQQITDTLKLALKKGGQVRYLVDAP